MVRSLSILLGMFILLTLCACDSNADGARGGRGSGMRGGGMRGGMRGGGISGAQGSTALPVRVELAARRSISQYIESIGVLEAENDVEIVSRVAGPIVKLKVEEGMEVKEDQLLALIDDREYRNKVAAATVSRDEAKLVFDRAQVGWDSNVISREEYDTARIKLESAETELKSAEIQLGYTEIRAPFRGLIATRHIKQAQYVGVDTPLFRLSDFDPLWCPIQVPEKDLQKLRVGQDAHLHVDAFPGHRFPAEVLRVSPVVDAATGTLKVTLEVEVQSKLRPGMFASVFVETDIHHDALVIPKAALVLDSIGDTVYIATEDKNEGNDENNNETEKEAEKEAEKEDSRKGEAKKYIAARREVKLGFRETGAVEVLEGLADGDQVIVLGQDGLVDGTRLTLLAARMVKRPGETAAGGAGPKASRGRAGPKASRGRDGRGRGQGGRGAGRGGEGPRGGRGRRPSPEMIKNASPEQLEVMRNRMRGRGVSEEEIKERLGQASGSGQ